MPIFGNDHNPQGYLDFACLAQIDAPDPGIGTFEQLAVQEPSNLIQQLSLTGNDISVQYPTDEFVFGLLT